MVKSKNSDRYFNKTEGARLMISTMHKASKSTYSTSYLKLKQKHKIMWQIDYHQNFYEHRLKELCIDLDIRIACQEIAPHESLSITPVLTKGEYRRELPQLLLNGKMRHKAFKAIMKTMSQQLICKEYNIYEAYEVKAYRSLCCSYMLSIAYEPWMADAKIQFKH